MYSLYENEFFKSLIIPKPLNSIEKKLKKNHSSIKVVKGMIKDYIKENSELYEDLAEMMLELMRSEISFEEPNELKLKEYGEKIKELDKRFKYVDHFIDKMSESNKSALWRDYVLESISNLKKLRVDVVKEIKNKEAWNTNDALFVSYYDLYTKLLSSIAIDLAKSKKLNNRDTVVLAFVSFIYQVVIYAYIRDELDERIMLRRFSELRLIVLNATEKSSNGRKALVDILKDIPPISE